MNKELLQTLLSEERPIDERLEALASVKDLLGDRDVVAALASMYPDEKSSKMRRALLDVVIGCQDAPLEFLYTVVAREPEEELRLAAVRRLAKIPDAEELLVECVVNDLSEEIQAESLKGIRKNAAALHEYAATAPASLKPALMALFDGDSTGLSKLLDPTDPLEFKERLLDQLSRFPKLPAPGLLKYLKQEVSKELRGKALSILMERTEADPELALSEPELLKNRLDSYPELAGKLTAIFKTTRSSRLKQLILKQLDGLDVFLLALSDPSPAVRRMGVEGCLKRLHRDPEGVTRAFIEAIPKEPLVSLREAMIPAIKVEKFLIEWYARETDPRLEQALAAAIVNVSVTEENRAALLRIYLRILREAFFDARIKHAVLERLTAYAHRVEPELKRALIEMLERASDLDTVERADKLLRLIEPDPRALASVRLKVFYRFVGRYPIDPLVEWLREFQEMKIPEMPYVAAISGATWVASDIMDCIQKDSIRDATRLLHEGYQNRTLKKSELLGLFHTVLNYHLSPHNSYPMLDSILKIMAEAKVVTPEVVDRCFDHIKAFPHGGGAYSLRRFLIDTGPHERLRAEFTAENYREFCLRDSDTRDPTRLPQSWGDSDHWRLWHSQWPIGEMVRETLADWKELVLRELARPIDPKVPCQQSFHYYLLYQLWRDPSPETRAAVGRFMREVRSVKGYELLYDRALFLFCDRWEPAASEEISDMAAEAFVELWRRRQSRPPKLLHGMSVDRLRSLWPWGESEWQALWDAYAKGDRAASERAPEFYFPCHEPQTELIDFLLSTRPGSHEALWKKLLRAVNGRTLEYRMERLPAERRAELLKLMESS